MRAKFRSSRPLLTVKKSVFCNKGVLRRKQETWNIKKRLWHKCFHVNFAKFLRTPFLTEHLRWLLLQVFIFFSESLHPPIRSNIFKKNSKAFSLRNSWYLCSRIFNRINFCFLVKFCNNLVLILYNLLSAKSSYLNIHT